LPEIAAFEGGYDGKIIEIKLKLLYAHSENLTLLKYPLVRHNINSGTLVSCG
jgi:hypothetical protein